MFNKYGDVVVLCYSITDRSTLEWLNQFMDQLKSYFRKDWKFVLVGTKSDLEEQREITKDDVDDFIRKNVRITHRMETSALSGAGVTELFD